MEDGGRPDHQLMYSSIRPEVGAFVRTCGMGSYHLPVSAGAVTFEMLDLQRTVYLFDLVGLSIPQILRQIACLNRHSESLPTLALADPANPASRRLLASAQSCYAIVAAEPLGPAADIIRMLLRSPGLPSPTPLWLGWEPAPPAAAVRPEILALVHALLEASSFDAAAEALHLSRSRLKTRICTELRPLAHIPAHRRYATPRALMGGILAWLQSPISPEAVP